MISLTCIKYISPFFKILLLFLNTLRTLEIKACDNTVKKGSVAPILSSIFVKFKLFKDYEEMKIKKCIFLKKKLRSEILRILFLIQERGNSWWRVILQSKVFLLLLSHYIKGCEDDHVGTFKAAAMCGVVPMLWQSWGVASIWQNTFGGNWQNTRGCRWKILAAADERVSIYSSALTQVHTS